MTYEQSKITIRRARSDDATTIAQFNIEMALESEDITLDPETIDRGVRAALADESKGIYFLAEIDRHIAGQLMITHEWSDWRNGDIWWIQSVYVPPAFRRRGVFRELYRYVEADAQRSGAVKLRLYVERDNTSAQRTYESLGLHVSRYLLMETGDAARGD
jgi:ribosomal protein S18 acetylase RimI-like enzyme